MNFEKIDKYFVLSFKILGFLAVILAVAGGWKLFQGEEHPFKGSLFMPFCIFKGMVVIDIVVILAIACIAAFKK